MNGEHLLHAHAVGDTTDGEGLLDAAVLLGNDGTLEHLNTLTGSFLDLHVDTDSIAHFHLRHVILQLLFIQCFDEIHGFFLLNYRRSCRHFRGAPPFSGHRRQRTALFMP